MRVVLDTNVLVSGLLSAKGPPAQLVESVLAGTLELAWDAAIRHEYGEVLARPEFKFPAHCVEELLSAFDRFGFVVAGAPPCPTPLPDADDECFLAVARASGSILVTGNLRHYPVRARHGVVVLTPREFVERMRGRG
jgi:putative PIN family toxin of toxin-antitoxin system